MDRKQIHEKIHYYLILLVAFCLPIARLTPLFIFLLFLNWLVEGNFTKKFKRIFSNRTALLFISLYFIHIIGLLYTNNLDSGAFDLQVKLSILLFPLVFASKQLNAHLTKDVFKIFMLGAFVSSAIMLGVALVDHFQNGSSHFFYQEFSFLIHPSYLSMYICLIMTYLIIELFKGRMSIIIGSMAILFFIFINILLASKLGLLVTILIIISSIVYYILSHKKYLLGLSALVLVIGSVVVLLKFVPAVSERVHWTIEALKGTTTANKSETESSAVRVLVWGAANNVIKENAIVGVGTGDAKDELMAEYQKEGLTGAYEKGLNAHNAYYQICIALGIIGLLILLSNLFIPLFHSYKTSNTIYFVFLLIIIINFTVESMLETQAGVMFYAFFNSLLYFNFSEKKDTK